jgi:hypothetical protein
VEDASLDPEPIMVTEAEVDPALAAILDRNVGLGGGDSWGPHLSRRLRQVAVEKGVEYEADSDTDEQLVATHQARGGAKVCCPGPLATFSCFRLHVFFGSALEAGARHLEQATHT